MSTRITDISMDGIERLLQSWGEWLSMGTNGGDGYPRTSPLHHSWMPPSPGMSPAMKASRGDRTLRVLHSAIGIMSMRLANTLVVVYVQRVPPSEQALRLQCGESTVRARVREAKLKLRAALSVN